MNTIGSTQSMANPSVNGGHSMFKVSDSKSARGNLPEINSGKLDEPKPLFTFELGESNRRLTSIQYSIGESGQARGSDLVTVAFGTILKDYDENGGRTRSMQEMASVLEERLAAIDGNESYSDEQKAFERGIWKKGFTQVVYWSAEQRSVAEIGDSPNRVSAYKKFMENEINTLDGLDCNDETRDLIGKGLIKSIQRTIPLWNGVQKEVRRDMIASSVRLGTSYIREKFRAFQTEYAEAALSLIDTLKAKAGVFDDKSVAQMLDSGQDADETDNESDEALVRQAQLDAKADGSDDISWLLTAPKVLAQYNELERAMLLMQETQKNTAL